MSVGLVLADRTGWDHGGCRAELIIGIDRSRNLPRDFLLSSVACPLVMAFVHEGLA